MEYANEEVIKIRRNTNLKRLKIGNKRWTSRLLKTMARHKLISVSIVAFLIFSILNIVMIYSFMQVLGTI